MDGHAQRRALTAAERAIDRLAAGDGQGARRAAGTAADLDQLGIYRVLPDLVGRAAAEIDTAGMVAPGTVREIVDALGPGPLAAAASSLLGREGR